MIKFKLSLILLWATRCFVYCINVSNYELAVNVILQSVKENNTLYPDNSTLNQIAHDYIKSIISMKNKEQFEENFELTHNKNISGFDHIFNDFLIFKSIIEYNDFALRDSRSKSTILPMITPFGQCISYYKGQHKSHIRIEQINPDTIINSQSVMNGLFHHRWIRKSLVKFIEFEILLHSSDTFPLLTAQEIYLTDDNYNSENSFVLKLSRYEFERLPKPYETNCHN